MKWVKKLYRNNIKLNFEKIKIFFVPVKVKQGNCYQTGRAT